MGRKGRAYGLIEPPARIAGGRGSRRNESGRRSALERLLETRGEAGQARRHRHTAGADRLLVHLARERQHARRGQRPEQHRTDDAAGVAADRVHVETHQPPRFALERRQHRGGVGNAIAERGFFGDSIDAVSGGDHGGAIRAHEPTDHCAARFHELGGDDEVHIAGHGHERKDGRGTVIRGRTGLDVVDRGAGALGHSRHRRALHQPAAAFCERDDPVREHAPALTAERAYGDANRPTDRGLRAIRTHAEPAECLPCAAGNR
jgi:hypothetical protein